MSPNINTWCTVNIYPFQTNIFSDTQMQEIENSQQQNRKGLHSWLAKGARKKKLLTFHNWVVFHPLRKPEKQPGYFETIINHINPSSSQHLRSGQQSKPMPRSLANISGNLTRQPLSLVGRDLTCSLVELGCLWRAQAFRICWDSTFLNQAIFLPAFFGWFRLVPLGKAEVFDGVHPKLLEQEGVDPVATA